MKAKDLHGICDKFIDNERKETTIDRLYLDKYSIGLNEFWCETMTDEEWDKIKENREKQLDITLDYLYPLFKEGKLKARVSLLFYNKKEIGGFLEHIITKGYKDIIINALNGEEIDEEGIFLSYEWKKEEAGDFIKDYKNIWKSLETKEQKESFEMYHTYVTLPENDFGWEI